MPLTEGETTEQLLQGITDAIASGAGEGKLGAAFVEILEKMGVIEALYVPDEKLLKKLEEYHAWCAAKEAARARKRKTKAKSNQHVAAGKLLEEIAYLAFRCIRGIESTKSFQSYAAQHDLIVSGAISVWGVITDYLHIPRGARTVVVEAKNLKEKVNDAQLSRLCSILNNKFQSTSCLGVFLTREGATGFPKRGAKQQRTLRDARATQILFHAKTGKFVVVLEHADIERLGEKGALLKILEAKIRDVFSTGHLPVADFLEETWQFDGAPQPMLGRIEGSHRSPTLLRRAEIVLPHRRFNAARLGK